MKTLLEKIKSDSRVADVYSEGKRDWWVHLKDGYICEMMGCGTIHEETLTECYNLLKTDIIKIENQ